MSSGADQIRAERHRQIVSENHSVEYDLTAGGAEPLMDAAVSYLASGHRALTGQEFLRFPPSTWPWPAQAFKPTEGDPKRDLVKAGALIAAAIDQLDLAEQSKQPLDTRGFDFTSMRGVPADAPAAEEG